MKTFAHWLSINFTMLLVIAAFLTLVTANTYAMFSAFGWYSLIFMAAGSWVSHRVSLFILTI